MSAPGFLGVLMLDTRFPRPPGDIGNRETFERAGIPVRFATLRGASPQKIVRDADPAFLQPFLDEAAALAAQGARLISTSCGFLARYQAVLQAAVPVPVVTSSLLQCRDLEGVDSQHGPGRSGARCGRRGAASDAARARPAQHRAGMHQYAALPRNGPAGHRPAGARH